MLLTGNVPPEREAVYRLNSARLDADFAFRWVEPVPLSELSKLFAFADVIVDQFNIGASARSPWRRWLWGSLF